jgi:hypothetical protein
MNTINTKNQSKLQVNRNPENEIKNIQAIRNCIVHSDCVLTCKKDEQIRNYIKTRQDISIDNNNIAPTADYCRYAVNTFSAFEVYIKGAL